MREGIKIMLEQNKTWKELSAGAGSNFTQGC